MSMQHKQFSEAFENKLGDLYKVLESKKRVDDIDSFMKQVHKQHSEVKEMTQEFELECGEFKTAKSVLKDCNTKLRQAKQAIMETETKLSREQEIELFGGNETVDEEDGSTASFMRQKKMLEEGRRNLGQGIEYATNISGELTRQGEKLQKSIHTTNEITGDLGLSTSLIRSISTLRRKNKIIYYVVVFLAISFVAFFIAKKLF